MLRENRNEDDEIGAPKPLIRAANYTQVRVVRRGEGAASRRHLDRGPHGRECRHRSRRLPRAPATQLRLGQSFLLRAHAHSPRMRSKKCGGGEVASYEVVGQSRALREWTGDADMASDTPFVPRRPIPMKDRAGIIVLEDGELEVIDSAFVLVDKTGARVQIPRSADLPASRRSRAPG